MATFELTGPDGGTYHVDAPDEHAAISAFSAFNKTPAAPPPDKYQQAAIDEQAKLKAAGGDEGAGFTRRLAHGATLGADSTILAGMQTPLEMIKHGTFSPKEGYNYAKAREDQIMGDARKNTGTLGDVAEMAGGAVAGGGLANAGVTAGRVLAPEAGLLARAGASAADAGGIGAVSGFNEGNGIDERLGNAAKGLGTGALIGGALPFAGAVAHGVAAPIFANIRARVNPEGFAQSQFARVIHDSGQTPQQIGQAVQDANAAGLPFTPADAMGNAGQKALAAVVRGPGEGSTNAVQFLEGRQAGQGRRVANTLAEGFDAPQTAAQTEARLTAARGAQADAEYGAVRNDAQPVDTAGAVDHIDQILGTTPGQVIPQKPIWTPPEPKAAPSAQAAQAAPAGPKAQSLLEFIASKGGLGPDTELAAIGAHGHTVNVEGVGRRSLVKQGGWPLDYAAREAESNFYLRGKNGETATPNDLLDAIDAELRGQKRYPEGFEGYAGKREKVAMSERDQAEHDAHIRGIESDLADAGHGQLGPDVKARATQLMSSQGMDADSAVEHAFRQLEQEDAARHVASDFPGDKVWHAPDVVGDPVVPQPNDTVESALHGFRQRLARVNPNDFSAVQRIRGDISDAAQNAMQNGYGNKARLLGGLLRRLDSSLEDASSGFRQANANFRTASQDIDQIAEGRTAATRGRTEDTIPAFNALQRPTGQQAFRTGYVDPLIAQTQGAAHGVNKARPFTSDAFRDEAAAIAPRNAQMQQNLARENTMFETRARSMGGSKTAENFADDAAMAVDPHLIANVLSGNWHGAMRNVLSAGHTAMTGNTPAVRAAVGRMLLDRGVNPANLQAAIGHTVERIRFIQNLSRNVGRGAAGALAVERPGQKVS